jgi:hypothetical protein
MPSLPDVCLYFFVFPYSTNYHIKYGRDSPDFIIRNDVIWVQTQWIIPIIPATCEAEIRKTMAQRYPKLANKTPSQINSWTQWHMSLIPSYAKSINKRMMVQVSLSKDMRPYPKNN